MLGGGVPLGHVAAVSHWDMSGAGGFFSKLCQCEVTAEESGQAKETGDAKGAAAGRSDTRSRAEALPRFMRRRCAPPGVLTNEFTDTRSQCAARLKQGDDPTPPGAHTCAVLPETMTTGAHILRRSPRARFADSLRRKQRLTMPGAANLYPMCGKGVGGGNQSRLPARPDMSERKISWSIFCRARKFFRPPAFISFHGEHQHPAPCVSRDSLRMNINQRRQTTQKS